MVFQVVVCLSISALFSWLKLVEKVVWTLIQLWMAITVLQSCSLIDLTIKLTLGAQFISLLFEWEPSSLPVWGPLHYKMRCRVVWIYCTPPNLNALIRMPTLVGIMAITGIETVMELCLLGKANLKVEKSLTAWEQLQQVHGIAKLSQECCCFLEEYS